MAEGHCESGGAKGINATTPPTAPLSSTANLAIECTISHDPPDLNGQQSLVHRALLYEGSGDYVHRVGTFVSGGIDGGEAVMVLVPAPQLDLLRREMDGLIGATYAEDVTQLGSNPSQIIPALTEFLLHQGPGPARVVHEPLWADRRPEEIAEACRHDALINLALARSAVKVLCPYPTNGLDGQDVWSTHPELVIDGEIRVSEHYRDPVEFCADDRWRLAPPPISVEVAEMRFDDLARVRRFVQRHSGPWGLSSERADDLILAVNEVAANSIKYGGGEGVLRLWANTPRVICEIRDKGQINDPLVGRYPPGPALEARGLWLVNQLCDLVEMRSGPAGTQTRLTIYC